MNLPIRKLLTTSTFGVISLCLTASCQAGTCPGPATNSFTGCYYSNTTLSGNPVLVRTDPEINFYWGNGSPDASLPPLNFSVLWQGNFTFTQGTYSFVVTTSDGMRLYVDGNLLIDRWRDQPPFTYTKSYDITAGTHLIVVEYYEKLGGATAQVAWNNSSAAGQAPLISSFTATPPTTIAGQPVTLTWNVSGATAVSIDNGIGDVNGRSAISVLPSQSTTYTLTASNNSGSSVAQTIVSITSSFDTQPPTAPVLISATTRSSSEVDLVWTASPDNVGATGYQILRNGGILTKVPGSVLSFADTGVSPTTSYSYSIVAFDAAGNYSAPSNQIQVTTPSGGPISGACPAPANGAFTGCYYSNTTLSGNPAFVRTDPQINFYWGNSSPDTSLPPLNFSARWQGNFNFVSGMYVFSVTTSDGIRLYVDGNIIIDRWRDQPAFTYTASYPVSQGTHLVVVEYYEKLGGATAQVSWQNNSPVGQTPIISSFAPAPSTVAPGQSANLAWTVAGATTITIDNGIGDVTSLSSVRVAPAQTTSYTLTATNLSGASTARTTVTVSPVSGDTQPPTPPALVSATPKGASEVDIVWTASTDNVGVVGYQILRNGTPLSTTPATNLGFADTTVSPGTSYTYTVTAYDAAGNYSPQSNPIQAATPAAGNLTVTWYGGCWQRATLYGVTGNFQAIDFAIQTSTPVPLQGTLFFAANCDASQGTDNMNDFNSLTGSTHMVQGFSFHPDQIPTSAYFWFGPRTADGKCAPGAPCSGCINYTKTTISCDLLP